MRFAAEVDVLGDRQIRRQRQFLVDDGDAVRFRRQRPVDMDRLAVDEDFRPGVRDVGPGQDFHQRRLSGAVLAH